MRTLTLILAAALVTAAPLAAQNTAMVVGRGRATLRIDATLQIPAYIRAEATQGLTQTWKGNGFTEYLATYTVRANTRWDLVTTTAPAGVTVLAQDGNWIAGAATIGNGEVTTGATVLVRVRVTNDAAANWKEQLQLEAVRGL
jgi:hypothetical protein